MKYEPIEIEVIRFESKDVIVTSVMCDLEFPE